MIPHNQEHIEAIQQESRQQIVNMMEKMTEKGKTQAKAILEAEEILTKAKVSFCSIFFTDGFEKPTEEEKGQLSWFHHGFDDTDAYDSKGNVLDEHKEKVAKLQEKYLEIFYQQALRSQGVPNELIFSPIGFSFFLKLVSEALSAHESTPYDLSDDEHQG